LKFNLIEESDTEGIQGKTLEILLIEKNRRLDDEITKIKLQLQDTKTLLEKIKQEHTQSMTLIDDQKGLIKQLEEDLIMHQQKQQNILKQPSIEELTNLLSPTTVTQPVYDNEQSILQIVSKQRDRFRNRVLEIESENSKLDLKVGELTNEITNLRADNVKLYEKIRYLQSYDNKGAGNTTAQSTLGLVNKGKKVARDIENPDSDISVENRYKDIYEDELNPWTTFNRKERYQRYKELNPAEKVTLNLSQFFLSHKYSRLFLFCYAVLLHLLVVFTLYHMANHDVIAPSNVNLNIKPKFIL